MCTKLSAAWQYQICERYKLTFLNLEENIMEMSPAVCLYGGNVLGK